MSSHACIALTGRSPVSMVMVTCAKPRRPCAGPLRERLASHARFCTNASAAFAPTLLQRPLFTPLYCPGKLRSSARSTARASSGAMPATAAHRLACRGRTQGHTQHGMRQAPAAARAARAGGRTSVKQQAKSLTVCSPSCHALATWKIITGGSSNQRTCAAHSAHLSRLLPSQLARSLCVQPFLLAYTIWYTPCQYPPAGLRLAAAARTRTQCQVAELGAGPLHRWSPATNSLCTHASAPG